MTQIVQQSNACIRGGTCLIYTTCNVPFDGVGNTAKICLKRQTSMLAETGTKLKCSVTDYTQNMIHMLTKMFNYIYGHHKHVNM